jgi:hypothetical protein
MAASHSAQFAVLGKLLVAVHPVGPTAIEGLLAKPIIDLLPVVSSVSLLDQKRTLIESLGIGGTVTTVCPAGGIAGWTMILAAGSSRCTSLKLDHWKLRAISHFATIHANIPASRKNMNARNDAPERSPRTTLTPTREKNQPGSKASRPRRCTGPLQRLSQATTP